jgi:hypothetical protein
MAWICHHEAGRLKHRCRIGEKFAMQTMVGNLRRQKGTTAAAGRRQIIWREFSWF